jgi:hypothetical protein
MRSANGFKLRRFAVFQLKSVVGCPARLRMISTGCEMESNGEHFWLAIKSMFERIDNPYLALEEVHKKIKLDW